MANSEEIYADFLTRFHQENLGIDMEQIIRENEIDLTQIEKMEYSISKANLFGETDRDLALHIKLQYSWYKLDKQMVYLYQFDPQKGYLKKWNEIHNAIRCELEQISGDEKKEMIIVTNDSGNGYTLEPIKIFSYMDGEMKVIFDEILIGDSYLPFKRTKDETFYNISFENEYVFEPNAAGGKSIVFSSKIFEGDDRILNQGKTKFVFNDGKFVPDGSYYDYRGIAKKIYDEKE